MKIACPLSFIGPIVLLQRDFCLQGHANCIVIYLINQGQAVFPPNLSMYVHTADY